MRLEIDPVTKQRWWSFTEEEKKRNASYDKETISILAKADWLKQMAMVRQQLRDLYLHLKRRQS